MSSEMDAGAQEHEPTRQRLLDAAEHHFAEHGFDGARVRDITTDAHCNVAAVNYHFGGKQRLYQAMFQRRISALRDHRISSIRKVVEDSGQELTLEQVVSAFTNAFLEPLVDAASGRRVMLLLMRERLDLRLPAGMFVNEMIRPTEEALINALLMACPQLDLQHARLSAFSLVAQLVLVSHMLRELPEQEPGPLGTFSLETLTEHITRFTCGALHSMARKVT